MDKFNVTCPYCGKKNIDCFLEETEGTMECENCKKVVFIDLKEAQKTRKKSDVA